MTTVESTTTQEVAMTEKKQDAPAVKVLVVDDEPQIVRALRINLSVRGYEVITAGTGGAALRAAADKHPDVVILDLGLPDIDGIEVLAGLRGWTSAPVIVLSARTDSADKVEALDAGADDYVTKPFGMDELLARLRAAGPRGAPPNAAGHTGGVCNRVTGARAGKKVSNNARSKVSCTMSSARPGSRTKPSVYRHRPDACSS